MSKDDIKELIAHKIKEKRKEKQMTQNDLAEKTELSRTYIADVERARYMPSVESLRNIANILEIDLGILTEMQGVECSNE